MIDQVTGSPLEKFKAEARQLLEASMKQHHAAPQQPKQPTDKVSLGNRPEPKVTYSADVSDADLGTTFTLLRDLFATTLKEQGIALEVSTGDSEINLESITPEQAQELVAEDGYFGVEKTAQRIFDFAVSISGNDPSRIDAIMAGIEDGFAQAEQAWGGTLPDISYETKDAVMVMLDEWVNAAAPGTE